MTHLGPFKTAAELYSLCYQNPHYKMGGGRLARAKAALALPEVGPPSCFEGKKTLLDVGCGRGEFVDHALSEGWTAWGYEIVPALCQRPSVDRMDGLPFPLPDGLQPDEDRRWDVVFCLDVLEHLPPEETVQSLTELWRVTRCDLVLSLPHFGDSGKHWIGDDIDLHPGARSRIEWVEALEAAGLPEPFFPWLHLKDETWAVLRRDPNRAEP